MKSLLLKFLIPGFLSFASFSCSVENSSELNVSYDQLDRIDEIARRANDTLAYSVANTGCDYRAYYLSMELYLAQSSINGTEKSN